jgi:hypothetical protein
MKVGTDTRTGSEHCERCEASKLLVDVSNNFLEKVEDARSFEACRH